jgi:integrase
MPVWGDNPIVDITAADITRVVKGVRDRGTLAMLASFGVKPARRSDRRGRPPTQQGKPAPGQARNLLGVIKMLFAWAVDENAYGLTSSPAADLKGKRLAGAKRSSDRALSDDEIAAFWRNACRLKTPYGPLYKFLLLTGVRLNEAADASWREFDLKSKKWTIPKERMKGTNERARAHLVPLTADVLAILETLPLFKFGDYVFSTTGGRKPRSGARSRASSTRAC